MPYQLAWLIWTLPVLSFLVISFVLRPFFNSRPHWSAYATIAGIGASLVLSLWALLTVMQSPEHVLAVPDVDWVLINGFTIRIGLLVDSLTAVMLVVVTGVSLLVQIYSQGYMRGDPGYPRYFAWMALFTANMLGLVMADSLLFMYVFWEGVGLCSYLLIGFWFHKPSAAKAAKKAFLVTRLGDFGFLAGILTLYFSQNTFDIEALRRAAALGAIAGTTLTWAAIGIFAGAAGKSAQFPLHTWLPDAMEGPTPVSSLIHAATMVAAGVFLVARTFPLFAHSEVALGVVAGIGAFTAIFAASMGLVHNDIKRVCAYSTISQLGYMMLALGAGGLAAYAAGGIEIEEAIALGVSVGIFHLFNHAFFKCLLFLGSGSVNHATGTFDMRYMGGLRRYMPWTTATFTIASLSLAGIWPFAGFWSKDEILVVSWSYAPGWFYLALATVFMTAFYIFRAVFMTFGGEYRGGEPGEAVAAHPPADHAHPPRPHESPPVMLVPMVVLAVFSVTSGWLNLGGGFGRLLGHEAEANGGALNAFLAVFTHPLPLLSLIVAAAGIFLAYSMYSRRWISAEAVGKAFAPIYTMLYRKYWMDELYERVIVKALLVNGIFRASHLLDARVVDGIANAIGAGVATTGRGLRRLQTGQLQGYAVAIVIGIVAILIGFYLWR
ncbi:MAG: NADH-quinone oxidoreductase subunit L [Chloroflexi bacterium]|nr:NADH-quinone oxidoreductase subunit L [Chloroflexota bacterium]